MAKFCLYSDQDMGFIVYCDAARYRDLPCKCKDVTRQCRWNQSKTWHRWRELYFRSGVTRGVTMTTPVLRGCTPCCERRWDLLLLDKLVQDLAFHSYVAQLSFYPLLLCFFYFTFLHVFCYFNHLFGLCSTIIIFWCINCIFGCTLLLHLIFWSSKWQTCS